jgi:hypothetical protein
VIRAEPTRETPGLHLLAAELYRDGVLLRWLFVAPSGSSERGGQGGEHKPPAAFSLWYDAGTAYTPQGGNARAQRLERRNVALRRALGQAREE